MEKHTAKEIAEKYISMHESDKSPQKVILDEYTIELESVFVFFYESSVYLKSGDINDRLAGNAPILIDRETGALHTTGTAHPIEFYIENYEKTGSVHLREN